MNKSDIFETELGFVAVVVNQKGQLVRCTLPEPEYEDAFMSAHPEIDTAERSNQDLRQLRELIDAYFAGDKLALNQIELNLDGAAPFFKSVWRKCRQIPFGEVRSYAWLAREAGSPLAIRAAGQAMARNRMAMVVPCHRVVGASGALHGFGGTRGTWLKQELLRREGVQFSPSKVVVR